MTAFTAYLVDYHLFDLFKFLNQEGCSNKFPGVLRVRPVLREGHMVDQ